MKVGLAPNLYPPELTFRAAELCEESGLDGLWLADHVVAFGIKRFAAVDAWTTLAALAVKTRRVRLGSSVSDPHRRHPETLAQIVATVDLLSHGRTVLGIGAGEAMNLTPFGVEWDHPVSRMREAVQAIKLLWTLDQVDFEGRFVRLSKAILDLKPVQRPHPPIWIGANSPRSLRLVGELGDGWIPIAGEPKDYARKLQFVRQVASDAGRNPEEIVPALFAYVGVAVERAALERKFLLPVKALYLTTTVPELNVWKHVPLNREMGERILFEAQKLDVKLDELVDRRVAVIGTPRECVDLLQEYVNAGARYLILAPLSRPEEFVETAKLCIDGVAKELTG
ncbi:MAG: LLM class flavin-dependent oxidoreductase [Nitrososphaerota archaeon]|nr:LLM class flavin-dependent oxidoreductase [Nitrososphaerota archaeon]